MTSISIAREIEVSSDVIWDELRRIDRHVLWMSDARSITFTSDLREGVGTAFICRTQVGPFRTDDRMEITGWEEHRSIRVRHRGVFQGEGVIAIEQLGPSRTRLSWDEHLSFPPYLLGPLGAMVAAPILRMIWKRNLVNFEHIVRKEDYST
ncbi:MAG: SRPBCC family protein [Acidimicrobiales bacterium]